MLLGTIGGGGGGGDAKLTCCMAFSPFGGLTGNGDGPPPPGAFPTKQHKKF